MHAQAPAEEKPSDRKKKRTDSSDSETDTSEEEDEDEEKQVTAPLDPSSATHMNQLLPLRASLIECLYYCDDCSELRCTRCVIEEPAGYHCPNCLFDVPTASVRGEKNCCARNCFQCPACTHVLSVVEGDRRQNDKACFVLACSVCLWNSAEIEWTFEKATGISAQIERMREANGCHKEFTNLLNHWRTVQRASAATVSNTTAAHAHGSVTAAAGGAFKHRLGGSAAAASSSGMHSLRRAAASAESTSVPEYTAACYAGEEGRQHLDRLMSLKSADYVPYTTSPLVSEPQRVQLHMKVARRCRQCHHILIKPESKAQATRFKIQLMAANFLPTITVPATLNLQKALAGHGSRKRTVVLPCGPFTPGETLPLALRFSNPLYTEMHVVVEAPSSSSTFAHIDVMAPRFMLPPFTELWEYDDDDDSDGASDKSGASASTRGILDHQGNRVAIQINIVPLAETSTLKIPLRVTCSHVDDMDVNADGSQSTEQRRAVKNSFWVYVILGE
ncbi:hypothetical protein IW138_001380 [Coemansia sp. RSA 986]|nr:hypothetical protein IW138_001380 [Coemansia sp. RSA 986]